MILANNNDSSNRNIHSSRLRNWVLFIKLDTIGRERRRVREEEVGDGREEKY